MVTIQNTFMAETSLCREGILPSTLRFNAELEKLLARLPSFIDTPVAELRAMRESGKGYMGLLITLDDIATTRKISGPAGDISLRIFRPPQVNGVYLHFHEGGWSLGGAHHQDVMLWSLARACNVAVVSVDYRLVPEHPFPAGLIDCEYAALWLIDHALAEFGSERLLIGGESTGAHLAVLTLLWLRDRYGFSEFRGANLAYGMYDLSFTPSLRACTDSILTLDCPTAELFCNYLLGETGISKNSWDRPDISPLYADLVNMPPALFTVGTYDALLDDTLFMHERWRIAENESRLTVYTGAPHRFTLMSHPLGILANQKIYQFMREKIAK